MNARGFTLLELVVAITISSIVLIFVSMFLSAPVDAYDAHARRNTLVADAAAAWPRLEADLRQSLPNSIRTRRNGSFVVIELLHIAGEARYVPPLANPIITKGRLPVLTNALTHYLSVNNGSTTDAYALVNTITPAGAVISIADGSPGESSVSLSIAPPFTSDSARRRIYLVDGPVAYLCDEGLGTLRRYSGYTIAANQTARDSPGEFTAVGATVELLAQGLSTCNFAVSDVHPTQAQAQAVAMRLTTTRNAESITLLHTVRAEHLP
jgi:MSHA biogenesis protein MshO